MAKFNVYGVKGSIRRAVGYASQAAARKYAAALRKKGFSKVKVKAPSRSR